MCKAREGLSLLVLISREASPLLFFHCKCGGRTRLPFVGYSVVGWTLGVCPGSGTFCSSLTDRAEHAARPQGFPVAIGEGSHPFPCRTRQLSPLPPMVLHGQPCGRVGHCRDFFQRLESDTRLGPLLCTRDRPASCYAGASTLPQWRLHAAPAVPWSRQTGPATLRPWPRSQANRRAVTLGLHPR